MRKSKFSESQIVEILKAAEGGIPVADLLRKHGVSKATFFKWRSKYGGASVADVKRLRELEVENARLKRMFADLALDRELPTGAVQLHFRVEIFNLLNTVNYGTPNRFVNTPQFGTITEAATPARQIQFVVRATF